LQGSTLFMDLGPINASDFISVTGGLTLSGSNLITLNNIFGYAAGTYTLMHYTGTAPATLANLGLTSANVGGRYAYLSNDAANSSIDVIIQDVATSAGHSFTGNSGASPAWLAAANWNDGVVPATTDIAIFSAAAPTLGTIGIDLGAGTTNNSLGNQAVGAIRLTAAPDRTINNSSSANNGTLTLNGVKGELLTNSATASTLTLANGSSKAMAITLGSFGTVEVTNAAAAIFISGNVGGPGGINKTGFGTFTLSGTNTYTGGTTISAGTLLINSAASGLGTGPAVVLSGATLGGTGVAGTPITIATDGVINPGVPGAVGTLTVGALTIGALSQNTAQFNFDVSATSVDKLISGSLTLNGSINFKLTKIGAGIPTNTFTLLDYTGTPLPNLAHFTLDASALPPAFIYTLVNNTANTSVDLAITPAANALTWDGTVNGTWDTAGPANWKGSATTYSNNKSLTFDDTASGTTSISITSAVAPAGVTFNNGALTYILSSTSGNIGGSTSLTMAGTGTTILSGTNTYTGGTTINSGTLLLAGPAMLPVAASGPSVILNPGGTLAFAPAAVTHAASLSAASTFFSLNGGKISLSNNDLFISGGAASAIAMNRALVAATSNGVALLTTGVMTGADWRALHPASTPFDTIANISAGDLLLRFGYAGDANFDGRITIDDYLLIDEGYLTGATDYTHGNFDHSPGPVDAADYALIDANYLNLSGTLAAGEIALHTAEFGAAYTDAFNALINPAIAANVPEPATLPLLTLSAATLLRRTKRAKRRSGA
jgi:fibronectin-binding autotransporter adhesin